jgi:hypothetical protein
LIFVNSILIFIFGIGIMQSMEIVAECSESLFWAGVLYEAYFTLFLARQLLGLAISCCVKKPKNFWLAWNSLSLCFDAVAFTWLTIWASM